MMCDLFIKTYLFNIFIKTGELWHEMPEMYLNNYEIMCYRILDSQAYDLSVPK